MNVLKKPLRVLWVLALLGAAIWCYARFVEPELLVTTKVTVPVPEDVAAGTIVFFSDTHFGKLYDQKHLERIVQQINAQQPDLVLFGGDFFDDYARDRDLLDWDTLQKQLRNINAPQGKYAVYGNHDYGGGAVRIYEEFLAGGGFTVLRNEEIAVEGLNLVLTGYDDLLLGYIDPALYQQEQDDAFRVLLCHEPDVAESIAAKRPALMLSGHSHGGQVSLPYLTQKILPPGATTYVKGVYEACGVNENIFLAVSRGIGMTLYPYRLLNVPEILAVELQPCPAAP